MYKLLRAVCLFVCLCCSKDTAPVQLICLHFVSILKSQPGGAIPEHEHTCAGSNLNLSIRSNSASVNLHLSNQMWTRWTSKKKKKKGPGPRISTHTQHLCSRRIPRASATPSKSSDVILITVCACPSSSGVLLNYIDIPFSLSFHGGGICLFPDSNWNPNFRSCAL